MELDIVLIFLFRLIEVLRMNDGESDGLNYLYPSGLWKINCEEMNCDDCPAQDTCHQRKVEQH